MAKTGRAQRLGRRPVSGRLKGAFYRYNGSAKLPRRSYLFTRGFFRYLKRGKRPVVISLTHRASRRARKEAAKKAGSAF